MNTYKVEYVENVGETIKTLLVTALDYTKAYFEACFRLPITAQIISVYPI